MLKLWSAITYLHPILFQIEILYPWESVALFLWTKSGSSCQTLSKLFSKADQTALDHHLSSARIEMQQILQPVVQRSFKSSMGLGHIYLSRNQVLHHTFAVG